MHRKSIPWFVSSHYWLNQPAYILLLTLRLLILFARFCSQLSILAVVLVFLSCNFSRRCPSGNRVLTSLEPPLVRRGPSSVADEAPNVTHLLRSFRFLRGQLSNSSTSSKLSPHPRQSQRLKHTASHIHACSGRCCHLVTNVKASSNLFAHLLVPLCRTMARGRSMSFGPEARGFICH